MTAVHPTLNTSSGGVSIYAGLTPSSSGTLAPVGSMPAGAGLPWDETAAAQADGFCGQPRAEGVCHAHPMKDDPLGRCYGHSRADAKKDAGSGWTSSTLNAES